MSILQFLRKKMQRKQFSSFADFFAHASASEKKQVFTEAAKGANRDQMEMVKRARELRQF